MNGFVYILQSLKNGRYYIGSTNDIERRLVEHNSGKTRSTAALRLLIVVFSKKYKNIGDARKMEVKLKKMKSRVLVEKL
jgi:putative endonuclease